MASTLITSMSQLVTCDGTDDDGLGIRPDAALIVEDERIAWIGARSAAPAADTQVDVDGRCVLPAFVDSHTHLIFAGDRSAEFTARMSGQAYDGGGIDVTVAATREASDDELRELLQLRLTRARVQGSATIEIKSGYGLDIDTEARMLRLAREVTDETTFLGAHVVPANTDRRDYLDEVTGPMLAACAPHARWVDVFCEPNSPHAFTEDESREVLQAGRAAGLDLRVHGNQLGYGPGVQLACELGAASVDHCTYLSQRDIDALADCKDQTTATFLPGVEFSTHEPYPDARRLIDAGASVALASDCNPGTCYSSAMPFMIQLAVRELKMTIAEAVLAATVGGARALRRDDIGRIAVGRRAHVAVLDAPSIEHLAYQIGMPLVSGLTP
ncbi:imidazolonepropionase [Bowdeniella nasicola]|uniref:Imidazolonepropionase n=1 Tax=Bowdeniella nasicola TaxID=208480 RepID=A0A1Q5Q3U2_9ACTO|nr:imidazolonepropionase [Bowdeniella nasicola]OKL54455.1 imidazolonepropionase [Bowdeniella nasicola]